MAIQRNNKWYPVVDGKEVVVYTFKNYKITRAEYDTKEEAEEQERKIRDIVDK